MVQSYFICTLLYLVMIDLVPEIRFSGTWQKSAKKKLVFEQDYSLFFKTLQHLRPRWKNMPRLREKMKKSLLKIHFSMAIPIPETHIIYSSLHILRYGFILIYGSGQTKQNHSHNKSNKSLKQFHLIFSTCNMKWFFNWTTRN